jgi:hypothetical protein
VTIKTARAALSNSVFTGISRNHLDQLVTELDEPFHAAREGWLHRRRGGNRRRCPGAGPAEIPSLRDRLLCTLAWLRLSLPHQAIAVLYGVDRSTISAAIRQIRPLLANRGFATPAGTRLHTLADVIAYAAAEGLTVRLDGTERLRQRRDRRRRQVSEDTVRKWRGRFAVEGPAGLIDRRRSGRPPRFTAMQRAQVTALACELPASTGVPQPRWSAAELADEAVTAGVV